jgi:UDP-N-acetylglucosamine--N-acetylmuramyl-(pentapeptide) pyrophosphoryl-undecaprenol N-acetylglucosamine transferase
MTKHILLAAGGTGGHLSPAVAIAQRLVKENYQVTLITDQRCEAYLPDKYDFKAIVMSSSRFSKNPFKLLCFIGITVLNILKISSIILRGRVSHVMSFGGYTSLTSNIAALLTQRSLILHEQNIIPGRLNRFFIRFAKYLVCSFEDIKTTHPDKIFCIGHIVREDFFNLKPAKKSKKHNILAFGGSQGAKFIGDIVVDALSSLSVDEQKKIKLSLQIRSEYIALITKAFKKTKIEYEIKSYFADIAKRMNEADLVISRAGASSISEIVYLKKTAILIPYIYAKDNHQLYNAKSLSDKNAAILLEEKNYSLGEFINLLKDNLVDDKEMLKNIESLRDSKRDLLELFS